MADVPIDDIDVENFELEMALTKGEDPAPEPAPAAPAALMKIEAEYSDLPDDQTEISLGIFPGEVPGIVEPFDEAGVLSTPTAADLSRYSKMLGSLPRGAVEAKMRADGLDPAGLPASPPSSPFSSPK